MTVTGTGLASVSAVSFGSPAGTNVTHDATSPDTTLTVSAPAVSGSVDVMVSSPGGVSATGPGDRFGVAVKAPRDFDCDGRSDVSVFRPSSGAWLFNNGRATVYQGVQGDIPVPCDYNGTGSAQEAVFRPSVVGWYRKGAATTFLGVSGDVPVPGMYNTAGISDAAVFGPSTGAWYIASAAPVYSGVNGDIPLPLPAAIRQAIPYP